MRIVLEKSRSSLGWMGLLLCVLLWVGCGATLAPFAQREDSKKGIEKAKVYNAPKHAKTAYEKAVERHEMGESLILTNKKSRKNKRAKEAYLESIINSSLAYTTAIEASIKEMVEKAKVEFESLKVENAHVELKENYERLGRSIEEVEGLSMDVTKRPEAYEAALKLGEAVEKLKGELALRRKESEALLGKIEGLLEGAREKKVDLISAERYKALETDVSE